MFGGKIGDQPEQGRFRRGISRLSDGRMKRGIAGNENNVTMSLPDHSWQNRDRAISGALIIYRKNLVPLIFPHAGQRNIPDNPGGTHEQIKWPRLKVAFNGDRVSHIKCAAIRRSDFPAGLCEASCKRFSQTAAGSCDDQVFHARGWWDGLLESRKSGYFQEHGKKLGITSEPVGGTISEFKKQGIMPISCSAMPNLFLPWNPHGDAGEQAISRLVHSMKKKIL